ncbi:hypothetical protein LCGC14_2943650 [marine sediment metagenome]|uniref:Transmembrane protein n=1 Tax=marine sediment metagenome TaxID=412755 RepID=A0A0F8XH69_9ZZZZ
MKVKDLITQIIIILLIALSILIVVRGGIDVSTGIRYDDVCKLEHDSNWRYEYVEPFGQTCVKVDYVKLEILDRKPFDLTNQEMMERYCDKPSFFNLKDWNYGCEEPK